MSIRDKANSVLKKLAFVPYQGQPQPMMDPMAQQGMDPMMQQPGMDPMMQQPGMDPMAQGEMPPEEMPQEEPPVTLEEIFEELQDIKDMLMQGGGQGAPAAPKKPTLEGLAQDMEDIKAQLGMQGGDPQLEAQASLRELVQSKLEKQAAAGIIKRLTLPAAGVGVAGTGVGVGVIASGHEQRKHLDANPLHKRDATKSAISRDTDANKALRVGLDGNIYRNR